MNQTKYHPLPTPYYVQIFSYLSQNKCVGMKKILEVLDDISKFPNRGSFRWGRFFSVLSWIVLMAIWLCRLLSLLQLLKFWYRKYYGRKKNKTYFGKQDSNRPDIPPWMQEAYFFGWLLLFGCVKLFHIDLPHISLMPFVMGYFLFESSVWMIYYTIFRRFFEVSYSIYHPIEYFVLLPIVACGQALAIHFVFLPTKSLHESFLVLMCLGHEFVPFYIQLIGTLYFAFILSIITSAFPNERRKSDNFYKVGIIGNGEVVKVRTLAALEKSSIRQNKITIFTLKDEENTESKDNLEVFEKFDDAIIRKIKECKLIFIATPSFCHVGYLEQLVNLKLFIVMEKPITVIQQEINVVRSLQQAGLLDNVFFLSYYKLEKALPLTYLAKPSVFYEKYLSTGNKAKLFDNYNRLGAIEEVSVYLVETEDKRKWIYEPGNGGHLFETFLHNVILASQFVGLPQKWNVEWTSFNAKEGNPKKEILLQCNGTSKKGTKLNLIMAKNMDFSFRGAEIKFEHGEIVANFDKQSLKIKRGDKVNHIKVHDQYKDRYAVQVDMAITCYENAIAPEIIDGYENQLEILEWLFKQKPIIKDCKEDDKGYTKLKAGLIKKLKEAELVFKPHGTR